MNTKLAKEVPILDTEHYKLKGVKLGDAPYLLTFMSDVETMKYITPHPIQTLTEAEN